MNVRPCKHSIVAFGGEDSDLSDRNTELPQGLQLIRNFEKFCDRFEFATKYQVNQHFLQMGNLAFRSHPASKVNHFC